MKVQVKLIKMFKLFCFKTYFTQKTPSGAQVKIGQISARIEFELGSTWFSSISRNLK